MSPASAIAPLITSYGLRPAGDAMAPDASQALPGALPLKAPGDLTQAQPSGEAFSSVLGRMVQEVSAQQGVANNAIAALQSGQNVSLHQAVIALEEANLSFQLMVEVRNKLLDSYQEIMRMQV